MSDAKRLVREREKLRREQALAEMSAILAHEIRNPLGSLELFAGLLAGAGLSAECREWVEHVQAGLRTLAATVNNVLHFHSLPAPERVPTDLGQLLDWAGGFLVPMARQARVELCLHNGLQGVWFAGRSASSGAGAAESGAECVARHAGRRLGGDCRASGSAWRCGRDRRFRSATPVRASLPSRRGKYSSRDSARAGTVRDWVSRCAARSSSSTGDRSRPRTAPGAGACFTLMFPSAEGRRLAERQSRAQTR